MKRGCAFFCAFFSFFSTPILNTKAAEVDDLQLQNEVIEHDNENETISTNVTEESTTEGEVTGESNTDLTKQSEEAAVSDSQEESTEVKRTKRAAEDTIVEVETFNGLRNALNNQSNNILITKNIEFTTSLTIRANVTIRGNPNVELTAGASLTRFFNVNEDVTNVYVKDLIINGNSQSRAFNFSTTNGDFVFENVAFKNLDDAQGSAIRFYNPSKSADDFVKLSILSSSFENVTASNASGSAIEVLINSEIKVDDSTFNNNGKTGHAISQSLNYPSGTNHNAKMEISNSSFKNFVTSDSGGAVAVNYTDVDGNVTISGSIFDGNKTTTAGGNGGALQVRNHSNSKTVNLMISGTQFNDNVAELSQGGAIYADELSNVSFSDVQFSNNAAYTQGGAVVMANLWDTIKGTFKVTGTNNSFIGNKVTDEESLSAVGGAMLIVGAIDTDIENTLFESNSSGAEGGAIDVSGNSGPEGTYSFNVSNSQFKKNRSSTAQGGALSIQGKLDAQISNVDFSENNAISGGAVFVFQPSDKAVNPKLTVTNSQFNSNTATMYDGGAVSLQTYCNYDATFENNTFDSNTADKGDGGAIFSWLIPKSTSEIVKQNITVSGSTLQKNIANQGGVISTVVYNKEVEANKNHAIDITVNDSIISDNTSNTYGGGIFVHNNASLQASNNAFSKNTAKESGGAVQFQSTPDFENSMNISDSKFESNKAGKNGGSISIDVNGDITASTKDADYNKYFASTVITRTSFTDNTAGNGAFILDAEKYPLLAELAKTNLTDIDSLSSPFLVSHNVAYNNHDINFMSDKVVKDVTVKYESNGGSTVPDETVAYNSVFTKPENPTLADHTFEGWFIDNELTKVYDFNTPATKDITLYAKWGKIPSDPDSGDPTTGTNTPSKPALKKVLPKTGEQNTLSFTLVGLVLLVTVGIFYWYKRERT